MQGTPHSQRAVQDLSEISCVCVVGIQIPLYLAFENFTHFIQPPRYLSSEKSPWVKTAVHIQATSQLLPWILMVFKNKDTESLEVNSRQFLSCHLSFCISS